MPAIRGLIAIRLPMYGGRLIMPAIRGPIAIRLPMYGRETDHASYQRPHSYPAPCVREGYGGQYPGAGSS